MLARNIVNELLYADCAEPPVEESRFRKIATYFKRHDNISLHHYTNRIYRVNADMLLVDDNLSSSSSAFQFNKLWHEGGPITLNNRRALKRRTFSAEEKQQAHEFFQQEVTWSRLIVSPNDPDSEFATRNMDEQADFQAAWQLAQQAGSRVAIEHHHAGDPFELLICNDRPLAIQARVPAFVVGDGVQTVDELARLQRHLRQYNILYRDYEPPVMQPATALDYRPDSGEIVTLNARKTLAGGAVCIPLPDTLLPRYQALVDELVKRFGPVHYMELQCYSEDIARGLDEPSFSIRRIRQNRASLKKAFQFHDRAEACLAALAERHRETKDKTPVLDKAPLFNNKYLNETGKHIYLKEAALRKGLQYSVHEKQKSIVCVEDRARDKRAYFSQMTVNQSSVWVGKAATDKQTLRRLFQKAGINTPNGFRSRMDAREEAWERIKDSGRTWVMKPTYGSGGEGITTDIRTRADFDRAWDYCQSLDKQEVAIEHQVTGRDYRLFVIDHKLCAVMERVPAHVTGDGQRTIEELIAVKREQRRQNPHIRSKGFELTPVMETHLAHQGLDGQSVPAADVDVPLLEIANLSAGGENVDRTDDVHPAWAEVAVEAKRAIFDPWHAGLDFMAEDISRPPHEQTWHVIELNNSPMLGGHVFPVQGKGRDVAGQMLDNLFGEVQRQEKTCHLKIRGKVQGVGFRRWFRNVCGVRSARGYVRNSADPEWVEAVVSAPDFVLEEVVRLSRKGPKRARVEDVRFYMTGDRTRPSWDGFLIL